MEQHQRTVNLLIPNCRQLSGFGWRGTRGSFVSDFSCLSVSGKNHAAAQFFHSHPRALLSGSWQRSQWTILGNLGWLRRVVCDRRNQQMDRKS